MPRTFNLLRTLGRGAHGTVHLAELRDEEGYVQTLAIKRLLPEWSGHPDLVARLKDEAKVLAFLHHDHVVRVHGLTRIDGALAILMEPVDGQDLGQVLARGGKPEPRVALEIVEAVADALDAAWCTVPPGQDRPLAVVHRDIKPSNVMLTPRGGVKVMDFGVAHAVFDAREGETKSQQFGTARYMAPERWLHGTAVHESDVFALGVTLIELVTGGTVPRLRLSPEAFAEDLAQALAGVVWEPLRALAARMTAFRVEDRPTAATVAAECRAMIPTAPGPSLREWAALHVVPEPGELLDPTCTATVMWEDTASRNNSMGVSTGDVLTAPPNLSPPRPPPAVPVSEDRGWWLAAVSIPVALIVLVALIWSGKQPKPIERPTEPVSVTAVAPEPEPEPVIIESAQPEPVPVPPPAPPPPPPPEPVRPSKVHPKPEPVPEPVPEPPPTTQVSFQLMDVTSVYIPAVGKLIKERALAVSLPQDSAIDLEVEEEGRGKWRCTISVGVGHTPVTVRKREEGGCRSQ
jgi:serine/threonine protein kinase